MLNDTERIRASRGPIMTVGMQGSKPLVKMAGLVFENVVNTNLTPAPLGAGSSAMRNLQ